MHSNNNSRHQAKRAPRFCCLRCFFLKGGSGDPRAWRQAKIVAIPKPGKDNCSQLPLLSVCFKALKMTYSA